MENFSESVRNSEPPELDLPDWSGMDDSTARIQPEAAFQLCEEYPAWFPGSVERWRVQRSEKCIVEFVL